jgi:glutaredoxin-like protein NrdH
VGEDTKIVLFALSKCPACRKTKDLLNKYSARYLCIDIDTIDSQSRDKLRSKLKQYNPRETFPTLVFDRGKEVVVGFGEEEIVNALRKLGFAER